MEADAGRHEVQGVQVACLGGPKLTVKARAYVLATGTIENAITARPAVAGREGRGQEIGFTVGTGDARIVVRSFKGSIQLRVR